MQSSGRGALFDHGPVFVILLLAPTFRVAADVLLSGCSSCGCSSGFGRVLNSEGRQEVIMATTKQYLQQDRNEVDGVVIYFVAIP